MKKTAKRTAHHDGKVSVPFKCAQPDAQQVCVAGTFNDWSPAASPMIRVEHGLWVKQIMLPPGRYEYRFVVDGRWENDPLARELVPNPFGGFNSVLIVGPAGVRPT